MKRRGDEDYMQIRHTRVPEDNGASEREADGAEGRENFDSRKNIEACLL